MTMISEESAAQSLGALLASLVAGDPCPCCGAQLSGAAGLVGTNNRGDSVGEARLAQPALVCYECGCEIDPIDASLEEVHRPFCRAA